MSGIYINAPPAAHLTGRAVARPRIIAGYANLGRAVARLTGVAVEPEGEGEQPPDLPAEVLPAGDVLVEHPRDGPGVQVPLPLDASRVRGRRGRTAQRGRRAARRRQGSRSPACGRGRSLGAASGASGPPQQPLLGEAAHLLLRLAAPGRARRRPGRGTAREPRGSGPCWPGRSSPAGRRRGRCRGRGPAGAPAPPNPRSLRSAPGRRRAGRTSARALSSSCWASAEKISFQAWWRSSGGRCAPRTKRLAL